MSDRLFCQHCMEYTEQVPLVNQYANECMKCGYRGMALGRIETESNKFYTPQGSEATLVSNTPDTVVFSIDKGEEAGYYLYDKQSGFGGIQKR